MADYVKFKNEPNRQHQLKEERIFIPATDNGDEANMEPASEKRDDSPTRRHKKKKRKDSTRHIEVQEAVNPRADPMDLTTVLIGMREAIMENTASLKALNQQQNHVAKSTALLPLNPFRRQEQVIVEVLLSFLHVIDVHTRLGYFHAELYVQAKWTEPGLQGKSQNDLDQLDCTKIWRPDVVLLNAVGEPDDVKRWYTTSAATPGGGPPTVHLHMRVRGQFKENLELRDFPVDIQKLSVVVSCERSVTEVLLIPNLSEVPTVTLETFNDAKEFRLWGHVAVHQLEANPGGGDKYARSAKLAYTCSVSRKPTYFFINGLLLQLLITALTFFVFVQSPKNFTPRASLAATLLLTSVAFMFTVLGDLPQVPYITYLGLYHLVCRIFQVVIIIESGVVFYIDLTDEPAAALTDLVCGVVAGAAFVVFNIAYTIILAIKYRRMYVKLVEQETRYKQLQKGKATDYRFGRK